MIKRYPLHTFILTVLTLAVVFQPGTMHWGGVVFLTLVIGSAWSALIYYSIKKK